MGRRSRHSKPIWRGTSKIWNRMSSGSDLPPPVHAVAIPKKTGGESILGVPAVSDRIAQMVVKQLIEPDLDQIFSYGYRPGKSALDAVGVTRQRCWKCGWVLDFGINLRVCSTTCRTSFCSRQNAR